MRLRTLIVVCVASLVPSLVSAQALTSLASVRVGYTTRKNTVKPQGELKAQIDALDAQIAEASRLGKNGELRRLFAKGIALLNNRPWTDAVEYSNSLVLRTEFASSLTRRSPTCAARTDLQPVDRSGACAHREGGVVQTTERPAGGAGRTASTTELVKELGTFEGVGRDLRELPFSFEVDVRDIADGTYAMIAEVADGTTRSARPISSSRLRKGVDDTVTRLETEARRAPENLSRGDPLPDRPDETGESRTPGAAHLRSGARLRGVPKA